MRIRWALVGTAVASCLVACENRPEAIFSPNTGTPDDVMEQNGYAPDAPFVQGGDTSFEDLAGGSDAAGRAKFCDEAEATAQLQQMVQAPIKPDQSVGMVPLWDGDTPKAADDLLGRPEDNKLCNPTAVFSNAFVWGPTFEIIVFFNSETRLVEGVDATLDYIGSLAGSYTRDDGSQTALTIKLKERLTVDGVELTSYADWLLPQNITAVYRMVRETFFQGDPIADNYDCVANKQCDIIYTQGNPAQPQVTLAVLRDSGVVLVFEPDGTISEVFIEQVRVAPFEVGASLTFDNLTTGVPSFGYTSATCSFGLDQQPTWMAFQDACIPPAERPRVLGRANYDVATQRDAVFVEFNGIDLGFLHDVQTNGVLGDGQEPDPTDILYHVTFTRSLNAPVAEFVPSALGLEYASRLEARLVAAIEPGVTGHFFETFAVTVSPDLSTDPEPIGELSTPAGNWIDAVITEVQDAYFALDPIEQAQIDIRVADPVFLLDPYVDTVMSAFSHTVTDDAASYKVFRTTNDHRWSIGYGHFMIGADPSRIVVQYSRNFGAITAVSIDRGYNDMDSLLSQVSDLFGAAYYELAMSQVLPQFGLFFYSIDGDGIEVTGFDRQLDTVDVNLVYPNSVLAGNPVFLSTTVPGTHIDDQSGYLRQISGERYDFIPAHQVILFGKETQLIAYVEADGTIGYIAQPRFKGPVQLCNGVDIAYGDDVRRALQDWADAVEPDVYSQCDIVFNYSENGEILNSVASLNNKVVFSTIDDRAVTASIWR